MPSPMNPRPGRNEPCHCGSGRKYKQCCLAKDEAAATAVRAEAAAQAVDVPADAPAPAPKRPPKHQTEQPWRGATSRGFVTRTRSPRKVGGA